MFVVPVKYKNIKKFINLNDEDIANGQMFIKKGNYNLIYLFFTKLTSCSLLFIVLDEFEIENRRNRHIKFFAQDGDVIQ